MTLGLAFWVIWLVAVIFMFAVHWGYVGGPWAYGNWVILFILLTLVAWKVFGPPIHG